MKGLPTFSALLLTLAAAGCATDSDRVIASKCNNLTGAALVECQKTATPTSRSGGSQIKMTKPPHGAGGMRGGMHN